MKQERIDYVKNKFKEYAQQHADYQKIADFPLNLHTDVYTSLMVFDGDDPGFEYEGSFFNRTIEYFYEEGNIGSRFLDYISNPVNPKAKELEEKFFKYLIELWRFHAMWAVVLDSVVDVLRKDLDITTSLKTGLRAKTISSHVVCAESAASFYYEGEEFASISFEGPFVINDASYHARAGSEFGFYISDDWSEAYPDRPADIIVNVPNFSYAFFNVKLVDRFGAKVTEEIKTNINTLSLSIKRFKEKLKETLEEYKRY